jgi:hypothetical protein
MAEMSHSGPYQVRSEPRGDHWVAWITRDGQKPDRSIVIVGETQQEAEAHARAWAEQFS